MMRNVEEPGQRRGERDEPGITRRGLIGAAAAGAGAAALPAAAGAKPAATPTQHRADVVVVGAGLAGLTAARELVKRGRSVYVMEARGRAGGRTLNHPIGGHKVVEVGGEWIGPTQNHIQALARELGVATFKTNDTGDYVYYANGLKLRYNAQGPLGPVPPDPLGAADAEQAILQINSMAATVPRDAPWTADRAVEWDSETLETWKQANLTTASGRNLLDVGMTSVFAAEPRDLSFLFTLFYVASATDEHSPVDVNRLFNTGGGAQDSRFVGGSQTVSLRLAEHLGGRVLYHAPARRIVQSASGVQVDSDHYSVYGKRVIVAIPPALTAAIDFEPQLPTLRAQLTQRMPQGSVIKCQAVYDTPFWRDDGLTGQAVSDTGPVKLTFDNSPPDGRPGVLLGFMEGTTARVWGQKPYHERRAGVLESFARYFGDRAAQPRTYFDMNWSEEVWTRGCYVGFTAPGVLLDYGTAIRAPVDRIHWAGAETATFWNGYMDGAVRSGERAAAEVLAHL